MHFEIVYVTGLSGFIGKNLLPHPLKKFPKVINFRRGNVHEIYLKDGTSKTQDDKNNLNPKLHHFEFGKIY